MSSKSWMAICIAVLIPLTCYLIVKYYSIDAVAMPRRYFEDSVTTVIKDGKEYTDTAWHQVKDITLTNQLGKQVKLSDVHGKVIVADFFFTHCGSICPQLTHNMKRLQGLLKLKDDMKRLDTTFVQLLSFSIDPERDSVAVLKKYADKYGVNHDVWWMLTGDKKTIYDFALNEVKLGVGADSAEVSPDFPHSGKFVLLDKNRVVRGYYNGLDSTEVARLGEDIVFLMLEKDKKKKSPIFTKLAGLWPIFLFVAIAVAIFLFINRKPKY
jgi:protein SCO1